MVILGRYHEDAIPIKAHGCGFTRSRVARARQRWASISGRNKYSAADFLGNLS